MVSVHQIGVVRVDQGGPLTWFGLTLRRPAADAAMLGLVNLRMPRLAASGLALAGTAAMVCGMALVVVHHGEGQDGYGTWYGDLVLAAALWAFTIMGWLVVRRQPSNIVGWLLLVAGVGVELGGLLDEWLRAQGIARSWSSSRHSCC